jgi:flagellar biosynthetic protein FliR
MLSVSEAQLFDWLSTLLLPFFRILGLFSAAPVLSQQSVPVRVRIAVSGLTAVLVAPTVEVGAGGLAGPNLIGLVIHEVLVGVTLGFIARVIFSAFEMAGEAIGLQMGLSFAGFFDPESGAGNPVARLLNTCALTAFVVMNGPGILLLAVTDSFQTIPIDTGFDWLAGRSPVMLGSQMFALALAIALPFIALLLFVNIALGVMSRVAPQFSVFSIGFPLTIGIGLVLLALVMPLLETPLATALTQMRLAVGG